MQHRHVITSCFSLVVAAVAATATIGAPLSSGRAEAVASGEQVSIGSVPAPPRELSTSGDFATDAFSNPWDFDDDQDVYPVQDVGVAAADGVSVGNGVLSVATRNGAEIRLLQNWSQGLHTLPWGHDGWKTPIDASAYTQADLRIRASSNVDMGLHFVNAAGQSGAIGFRLAAGQWTDVHLDLDRSAAWQGQIVRLFLFRGGLQGNPQVGVDVDFVRIHRADAPRQPVAGLPVAQLVSPGETAGADYATVERGNPWDFRGLDDVADSHDVANLAITPEGDLSGTTTGNDPSITLPLGPTLNTDRYHHLTIDVCYGGGFALTGNPGGGMVGRMLWLPHGTEQFVTSQDFLVFPGCNTIAIDLVTNPPGALTDETETRPTGWRGVRIDSLRFDLNEDPGVRPFTLRNITLTDETAIPPSGAPVTFRDAAGAPRTVADVYASKGYRDFRGVAVARDIPVAAGLNTFQWNGTDASGSRLPNGTYWLYVVIRNASGASVAHATAAARIEAPVPSAPSWFVPLQPARVLDTRDGTGGNVFPVAEDMQTEVRVTGVGGVPEGDVTAVVMNVTATNPIGDGYVTAWPSGEPRPLVSNINFVPGQTVPNLVTVKVGANGKVNLYNSAGYTDLIADVMGYYTTSAQAGGRFASVTPARLLDTRDGTGGTLGPLGLNGELDLTVTGVGGVPASGVSGVALNVTVDQPTGTGYLTVWPTGQPRPLASTHNYVPGLTVANMVIAKVGAGGKVSVYNSAGLTHVVADVVGYFADAGGLFVPVSPQRLVDTRGGTGGVPGPFGPGERRSLLVSTGPVPGDAAAGVLNVTSVDSTAPSFVTAWPAGAPQPLASTVNPRPGSAVPNQAYLRLGAGGRLDTYNNAGSTNLVVDVFGYFTG